MLSGLSVGDLASAVALQQGSALQKIPGIRKKTAERLLLEMRDRLKDDALGIGISDIAGKGSSSDEAFDALVALGYKPQEATRMVKSLDVEGLSSEEIIRRALQAAIRK